MDFHSEVTGASSRLFAPNNVIKRRHEYGVPSIFICATPGSTAAARRAQSVRHVFQLHEIPRCTPEEKIEIDGRDWRSLEGRGGVTDQHRL